MARDSSVFNAKALGAYVMLADGTVRLAQSRMEWAMSMERDRRVALDEVENCRVSTVFLGLDHGYPPDSEPLLFETMVFVKGEAFDAMTERYATHAQACEGHAKALHELRKYLAAMRAIRPDADTA